MILPLAGIERGFDVGHRQRVGVQPGLGEGVDGEFVEAVGGEFAAVFALQPDEFLEIEPGVVPENLRQVEAFDDIGEGKFFGVVLGRPAEEAEVIDNGFGQKSVVEVAGEGRALVALAHLRAVAVQDERDVRVMRRRHAERLEQRDVLGGVAQVVLAANDVRDVHFQIVNDIDEMEHRLAVGAHDDEIGVGLLAVGEFAQHITDDEVGNEDWLALHFEFDRAFVFVGQAVRKQSLDAALVILLALDLEIRPAFAFARAGGVAGERAFIPGEAKPAQAVEDDLHGFLRVARGVGVFDAQDEGAAGMAGVEPVEEGGAGAADVEEARRTEEQSERVVSWIQLFK